MFQTNIQSREQNQYEKLNQLVLLGYWQNHCTEKNNFTYNTHIINKIFQRWSQFALNNSYFYFILFFFITNALLDLDLHYTWFCINYIFWSSVHHFDVSLWGIKASRWNE